VSEHTGQTIPVSWVRTLALDASAGESRGSRSKQGSRHGCLGAVGGDSSSKARSYGIMGKVFVGGQGGSLAAAVVVQRAELDKILEEVCLAGSPTLLLATRRRIGASRRSV
jgi:hypothetical protein